MTRVSERRRILRVCRGLALGGTRTAIMLLLAPLLLMPLSAAKATTFCGATIPQEIVTEAAALKNNPDLIYEYVYNNIQTLPQHGSLKGPLGTLLDGAGTEVDQAELMASLLQAAGYTTAAYQTGSITIDAAQLTGWLGTDNTLYSAGQVLANGGFNTVVTPDSGGTHMLFVTVPWAWVTVQIGGASYIFDPAGKRVNGYSRVTGISNLASAMGYSQASFLASVESGATITDRTIAGLNRTSERSNLQTYSRNLVSYIRTNNPSASTAAIVGGTAINQLAIGTQQRILASTGFSYSAGTVTNYSCLPSALRTILSLSIPGAVPANFNTSDIYGHRLSLFFDSGNHPVLRLDGVVQATGSAASSGALVTLTTSITYNAYNSTFANLSNDTSLKVTASTSTVAGTYVISNGWGPVGRGMVQRQRLLLQQNIALNPGNIGAESVLGESLAMIGYTWLAQVAQSQVVTDQIAGTVTLQQRGVGIVGIKPVSTSTAPYVDLPLNLVAISQRTSQPSSNALTPLTSASLFTLVQMSSILESGTIEQTQPGATAVSTAKLIDIASQSDTIYDINNNINVPGDDSTYYTSTFRPVLASTWASGDLTSLDNLVYSSNRRVIAPRVGNVAVNSLWTGVGYYSVALDQTSIFYLITGGLNGGYPASLIPNTIFVPDTSSSFQPSSTSFINTVIAAVTTPIAQALGSISEPLNRVTGSFLYDHTDLSIGSSGFPLGLQFQRYYDSVAYLKSNPLGLGWTDNFAITAQQDSDGFEGMAINSPINGASAIATLYVMQDILNLVTSTQKPLDRVVIGDLAAAWLMQQMTNNVVIVTQPENVSSFVLLADGSYNPPFGSADQLSLVSGAYVLAQKDGTVLSFNSSTGTAPGAIASWQSPTGPTVSFSYNGAGNLSSVTTGSGASGTNRTLTLSYNGSNQLTGVSDGTGRSISYAYDASGELTSYTDPLGHQWTYAYDPANPGRMTQYFYPSAPTTAFITNIYDAMGRVISQTDALGDTTSQYFAGTRTETDDAFGNAHVLYFSARGRVLTDIDGLGNQTVNTYDGLDRLSTATQPEGNSVAYTYDTKSNPLTVTANPKSGSGLSPITQTFTYDPKWNKVSTTTDGLGLVATNLYDPATGSLLKTVSDYGPTTGSHFNATSSFTYNSLGQVLTATDPLGVVTQNTYDSAGNLLTVTRDVGTGHLNQLTTMTYTSAGDVATVTDPNSNVTSSTYDAGRQLSTVTAPNQTTGQQGSLITANTYDPDGKLLQTQQSVGGIVMATTSSTYTLAAQVATTTDANGNVTTNSYDAAGRLSHVTNPLGVVTNFVYDADGRRTQSLNPAIQTAPLAQTAYTANGLVASLTDANNNALTFAYDGLDRLSTTTWPDSSSDKETLTYDTDNNIVSRKTRKGDTISFAYDTLSRVCSKTIAASPVACGGTSANPTVLYGYDFVGRLIAANDNSASIASVSGTSASYSTSYTYNALNRPLTATWSPAPAQTTPTAASVTFNDTYDLNNRRTMSNYTDTAWMSYPAASASTLSYTANVLNQYTAIGTTTPTYDANGNLASDGSFIYCFDAESRLTGILASGTCASPGTTVASYAFDAQGRRKSKTIGATTTIYVADVDGHEVLEYDGTTGGPHTPNIWYAYGLGSNDVLSQMNVAAGTRETMIPDVHGSIQATLDSSTGAATKAGYQAYGENPSRTSGTFAYTAQRFDPETASSPAEPNGLYDYRAREYSPTMGRFLQVDPSGQGTNAYAYADNDPLNLGDPTGLSVEQASADVASSQVTQAQQDYAAVNALGDWLNAPHPDQPILIDPGINYSSGATVAPPLQYAFTPSTNLDKVAFVFGAATTAIGLAAAPEEALGPRLLGSFEPPAGLTFGTAPFGNEAHIQTANLLQNLFPDVAFDFKVLPGQRGVDVTVLDVDDVADVGFRLGEIKPDTASGMAKFARQVAKWGYNEPVQAITYDANGNVFLGFH